MDQQLKAIEKSLAEVQNMLKKYERDNKPADVKLNDEIKVVITEAKLARAWDFTFVGSDVNPAANSNYFRSMKTYLGFGEQP